MNLTIFKYKIFFFTPKKYDIIIVDELHCNIIKSIIPKQNIIFILKQRKQEFYLSFRILFNFIKIIKKKNSVIYYILIEKNSSKELSFFI
jgi:hypothetical protein